MHKARKSIKRSVASASNKQGDFINGKSYIGKTIEGFNIEFWYRNDRIETFYFVK